MILAGEYDYNMLTISMNLSKYIKIILKDEIFQVKDTRVLRQVICAASQLFQAQSPKS